MGIHLWERKKIKKKEKERSYLDLKMDNRERDGAKSDMKREGKKKGYR